MEKLPQIVSERLKALTVAANHPDADMLTAFSERTLSIAERAIIVEHLGNCSECREIVALALPIAEPDQQIVRTAKSAWLSWPVLRWGLVAAGIIVVGSFGLLQYQNRQRSSAAISSRPPESVAKEAKNVTPAIPTEATRQDNQRAAYSDKQIPPSKPSDLAASSTDTAGASRGVMPDQTFSLTMRRDHPVAKTLQHGPHAQLQQNANNYQSQTVAPLASSPAPARVLAGQTNETVATSAEAFTPNPPAAPVTENETASLDAGAAPLQTQTELRQLNSRVERSKPAASTAKTTAQSAAAPAGKVIGGPMLAHVVSANPSGSVVWSINSSGALQRSFDQGNTWQNVDVNAATSNVPLAGLHDKAKEALADSTKVDSLKKDVSSPVFRAVASNGPDVWAGASGGLLYHSTDAGLHWTRIVPASANARLSGDILSLEFPDQQHGRVVTATPEVWTTDDGGQTWLKQ
jgi:hypothetical protein